MNLRHENSHSFSKNEPLPPKKPKGGVKSLKMEQEGRSVVSEVEFDWTFLSAFFGQVQSMNLEKTPVEQKSNLQPGNSIPYRTTAAYAFNPAAVC